MMLTTASILTAILTIISFTPYILNYLNCYSNLSVLFMPMLLWCAIFLLYFFITAAHKERHKNQKLIITLSLFVCATPGLVHVIYNIDTIFVMALWTLFGFAP